MKIAVPTEVVPGERRVALVPDTVGRLIKAGASVVVQSGAGASASLPDSLYEAAGAGIAPDAASALRDADVVVKVARPTDAELTLMRKGTSLIAFLSPLGDAPSVERYASAGLTALSMDAIPRITRAQSMDALSSQSSIAGYKAVIIAAGLLPKFFPMLTTAAGTIPPAKCFILGAGVAGLQAIATSRRLGGVTSAYDARTVVKEQVQSLGATFLEIPIEEAAEGTGGYAKELSAETIAKQQQFMQKHIGEQDVVITTALVPGRRAPILVTKNAVEAMRPGSVIVDLAAELGGNCEVTRPGETILYNGVQIVGLTNLPATMPQHASQLYSKNMLTLLQHLIKDGAIHYDFTDEITKGTVLTHDGKILHEPTLAALQGGRA